MNRNDINYLSVGVFVVVMITILIVVLFKLTGRGNDTEPYLALFNKVTNIQEGTTVTYGGYAIGHVDNIKPIRTSGKTQYSVELALKTDWKIPTDSHAKIYAPGMLSDTIVEIQEGRESSIIKPGEFIPTQESAELTELMGDAASEIKNLSANKIQPLIQSLQDTIYGLGKNMDDSMRQISEKTLTLLTRLDNNSQALEKIASHSNTQRVTNILENADEMTSELSNTVKALSDAGSSLNTLLSEGNQIIAGNKNDIRNSVSEMNNTMETISSNIESIVFQLDTSSRNMNEFSRRIKENPGALLNGNPLIDNAE